MVGDKVNLLQKRKNRAKRSCIALPEGWLSQGFQGTWEEDSRIIVLLIYNSAPINVLVSAMPGVVLISSTIH